MSSFLCVRVFLEGVGGSGCVYEFFVKDEMKVAVTLMKARGVLRFQYFCIQRLQSFA